jgi:hypothetical protein
MTTAAPSGDAPEDGARAMKDDDLTTERIHAELLGGPARWLFSVTSLAALVLLVWATLEEEMEVAFPIHLQQSGILVFSAIALVIFVALAAVNWRNHATKRRDGGRAP